MAIIYVEIRKLISRINSLYIKANNIGFVYKIKCNKLLHL